jgi:hypothetical protein
VNSVASIRWAVASQAHDQRPLHTYASQLTNRSNDGSHALLAQLCLIDFTQLLIQVWDLIDAVLNDCIDGLCLLVSSHFPFAAPLSQDQSPPRRPCLTSQILDLPSSKSFRPCAIDNPNGQISNTRMNPDSFWNCMAKQVVPPGASIKSDRYAPAENPSNCNDGSNVAAIVLDFSTWICLFRVCPATRRKTHTAQRRREWIGGMGWVTAHFPPAPSFLLTLQHCWNSSISPMILLCSRPIAARCYRPTGRQQSHRFPTNLYVIPATPRQDELGEKQVLLRRMEVPDQTQRMLLPHRQNFC